MGEARYFQFGLLAGFVAGILCAIMAVAFSDFQGVEAGIKSGYIKHDDNLYRLMAIPETCNPPVEAGGFVFHGGCTKL